MTTLDKDMGGFNCNALIGWGCWGLNSGTWVLLLLTGNGKNVLNRKYEDSLHINFELVIAPVH